MANLVTITKESRLILKVGGIACGAILLLYILIKGGELVRTIFFPTPPPAPLQALGKLPPISFPLQENSNSIAAQYTVNTIDGQLPILPDRVNVYKLKPAEADLLALETAKNTLDSYNFVENQTKLTDTLYRWTQADSGIIIEYDIATKNFSITSNYLSNPSLISNSILPSEDTISEDTKFFLQTIDSNLENIDLEKTKVEYLEQKNGILQPAENLGSARFARVTLNQIPVDEISIVYGDPANSILSFIVSYPQQRFQIVEGDFYNYTIDSEQKSDYPIKTSEQAYEDLKNGNAYIVNSLNATNIDITDVKLHYYLGTKDNQYLLPVIVFSGINFTAYVEALLPTSLSN